MKKSIFIALILLVFIFSACKEKTYEVTFDLSYQTSEAAPTAQPVKQGEMATEPLEPDRTNYKFMGWFEEDATVKFDFSTPITADLVLFAHWKNNEIDFYLAGSFSNYNAGDENYALVKGENGVYSITVELTSNNRDNIYDGHYYKVTDGSWDNTYGVDHYYLKPAPLSPTGGGLGSIWHWANGTLTVTFDSKTVEITDNLEMSEEIIREIGPAIYGEFNNWSLSGESAFYLVDEDGDGIYLGTIIFEESGESDFIICLSEKWYDDQWGQRWGAEEQYRFDGTLASMGQATTISYSVGTYHFTFNLNTKKTTYTKIID